MTTHSRPDRLHHCKCDDCRAHHAEWKRQWRRRRANPANVRAYGRSPSGLIDYDAAIQAASYWSNPPSGQARANEPRVNHD